ncbi:MAG: hypothetical protein ACK4UU_06000, partial [Fimbriimonadales bacterium]
GSIDGKARLAERAKALIQRIPDGEFRDRMDALLVQRTEVGFHASARLSEYTRELAELSEQVQREAFEFSRGHVPAGYLVKVPQLPGSGGRSADGTPRRRPRNAAERLLGELPSLSAPRPAGVDHRRSLVRTAISLLLNRPGLAAEVTDLDWIETLEQPGIALFAELVRHARERPHLSTGALLEAFDGHEQAEALGKLAAHAMAGDEAGLAADFRGCLRQLKRQAVERRIEWLKSQPGLDERAKSELRALLSMRV